MNRNILDQFFSGPGGPQVAPLPAPAQLDALRRKIAAVRGRLGLLRLTAEQRRDLLRPPPRRLREVALFYAGFFRKHPELARQLGVPEGLLERLLQREVDSAQLVQLASELCAAVSGAQLRIDGAIADSNERIESAAARLVADEQTPPAERARIAALFKTTERDRGLLSDQQDRKTRKMAAQRQALLHRAARARGAQILDRVLGAAEPAALPAPQRSGQRNGQTNAQKKGQPR